MSSESKPSLITRRSIAAGLIAGLVHAGLAVILWNYFFVHLMEIYAYKPLQVVYMVLGMFVLGFVPSMLYVGGGLVTPAKVVGVFLLLSAIGSWLMHPIRAPFGGPTPFALYVWLWIGVIALAGW